MPIKIRSPATTSITPNWAIKKGVIVTAMHTQEKTLINLKKTRRSFMKDEYMKPEELKKKFLPELEKIFDITQLDDLKTDVEENDILNPITLSKDGFVIDGMRRIMVAINLGIEKVMVFISELDATPENRIALNNFRQMTWMDKRNLFILLFTTYAKQQGKRLSKYFDRYEEIAKRTKNRFKDKATLANVEFILTNDNEGYPMSRWLFEYNCDVKSIHEFMKLMLVGGHDEIYDRVVQMELSPKDALRLINEVSKKIDAKKREFTIPVSKKLVAEVHHGEPEELLVNIQKESVKALFFEPDSFVITVPNDIEHYPPKVQQKPEVYSQKEATKLLPWRDRIENGGSLFVLSRDFYKDGFSFQIPANLIRSISQETGFEYKQTFYVTNGETLQDDDNTKSGLSDATTQIFWFVKNKKEAIRNGFSNTTFLANAGTTENDIDGVYKSCSNILDNQVISDMIVSKGVKDLKKQGTNYACLIPILAATKEDDLIVDISMKSDIGSVAVLMNRRFIGISNTESFIKNSATALTKAVKEFSNEKVKKVTRQLVTELSETSID